MKNKVIAKVEEVAPLRFEVSFEEVGDIWKWINKNQTNIGEDILEKVRYNEVVELNYDTGVNKYLRRLRDVRNIEIIDEREKATNPTD